MFWVLLIGIYTRQGVFSSSAPLWPGRGSQELEPALSHLPALSTKSCIILFLKRPLHLHPFLSAFHKQQTLAFHMGSLEHLGPAWPLWEDMKHPACLWRRKTNTSQPVWEAAERWGHPKLLTPANSRQKYGHCSVQRYSAAGLCTDFSLWCSFAQGFGLVQLLHLTGLALHSIIPSVPSILPFSTDAIGWVDSSCSLSSQCLPTSRNWLQEPISPKFSCLFRYCPRFLPHRSACFSPCLLLCLPGTAPHQTLRSCPVWNPLVLWTVVSNVPVRQRLAGVVSTVQRDKQLRGQSDQQDPQSISSLFIFIYWHCGC